MTPGYYRGNFSVYDSDGEVVSDHVAIWRFERNYPTEPDEWILISVDGDEEKFTDADLWDRAEILDYELKPDNEYY